MSPELLDVPGIIGALEMGRVVMEVFPTRPDLVPSYSRGGDKALYTFFRKRTASSSVTLKSHTIAVIASSLVAGISSSFLANFMAFDASRGINFFVISVAVTAITNAILCFVLVALFFSIARKLLTLGRCNIGWVYPVLGSSAAMVLIWIWNPDARYLNSLLFEGVFEGAILGTSYWIIAARRANSKLPFVFE
jgi:hypothetical protein